MFLDESGAKTNLTRLWGRTLGGQRLFAHAPGGHWTTTTMLAALRVRGPTAPMVIVGPVDTQVFRAYVTRVLAPTLSPGDVVVLDNLSAHKAPDIPDRIHAVGASLRYLPAYSPDFNPIEQGNFGNFGDTILNYCLRAFSLLSFFAWHGSHA